MDAAGWTYVGAIVANVGAVVTFFIKAHYDDKRRDRELAATERRRIEDREQDRLDRKAAAELTADHRALMSVKLDANTAVSMIAAEKADIAAAKAELVADKTQLIVEQTIGMQDNLMKLAGDAGFRRGEDAEKAKRSD
jgi:urease gamma subunit